MESARQRFERKYPLIETYRGYEIRKSGVTFEAIIVLGCASANVGTLEDAHTYIDQAINVMAEGYELYGFNGVNCELLTPNYDKLMRHAKLSHKQRGWQNDWRN